MLYAELQERPHALNLLAHQVRERNANNALLNASGCSKLGTWPADLSSANSEPGKQACSLSPVFEEMAQSFSPQMISVGTAEFASCLMLAPSLSAKRQRMIDSADAMDPSIFCDQINA